MKVLGKIWFLLAFFCLSNCAMETKPSASSEIDKEALMNALEKFNNAFKNGNTDVLESMITEDYKHTNGNSKSIGKKDWLSYLRKREIDIHNGNLSVTNYELSEVDIKFHGNVAIVTGKVSVSSKYKDEIRNNEYRITNIWVYDEGNWKRAGFHDGKIK